MTNPTKDLLGNPLSADELELVELYRRLQRLAGRDDLPPVATANVKQAMVMLWNACNDLALIGEEPGND
ncbi:MAG: hypothetical protein K8J09_04105 [Planctomycetes bacterium]|nr:hypothetical protein [Planctomycetota bacterium]MCC7397355.1 hypothetical protein [Planctomycetota bacterium]